MITFGKYKGKTFEYVLKNHRSYCCFILSMKSTNSAFTELQNYIRKNIDQLCNLEEIKNKTITCSELSRYLAFNSNVEKLIDFSIIKKKIPIVAKADICPSIFGQFIDYYFRYQISSSFRDSRTECILSNYNYCLRIKPFEDGYICKMENEFKNSEHRNIINNSYDAMKNKNAKLKDILNVAICHSMCFGKYDVVKYLNLDQPLLSAKEQKNIDKYISKRFIGNNIQCNPTLGSRSLLIEADADLIIDDELIDIKTTSFPHGENVSDFVQLFIYATLYYVKSQIKCKKLTIINPVHGYEYSVDISTFDYVVMYEILKSRNVSEHVQEVHHVAKVQ